MPVEDACASMKMEHLGECLRMGTALKIFHNIDKTKAITKKGCLNFTRIKLSKNIQFSKKNIKFYFKMQFKNLENSMN